MNTPSPKSLRVEIEQLLWKLSDYRPGESRIQDAYVSETAEAILAAFEAKLPERQEHDEECPMLLQLVQSGELFAECACGASDYNAALDAIHKVLRGDGE